MNLYSYSDITSKWKCSLFRKPKNCWFSENQCQLPALTIIIDFGTIILDFGSTRLLKLFQEKIPNLLLESAFCWSRTINFWKLRKRRMPNNPWDPSNRILEILNLGSRTLEENEMDILVFSFQLQEILSLNMKLILKHFQLN